MVSVVLLSTEAFMSQETKRQVLREDLLQQITKLYDLVEADMDQNTGGAVRVGNVLSIVTEQIRDLYKQNLTVVDRFLASRRRISDAIAAGICIHCSKKREEGEDRLCGACDKKFHEGEELNEDALLSNESPEH